MFGEAPVKIKLSPVLGVKFMPNPVAAVDCRPLTSRPLIKAKKQKQQLRLLSGVAQLGHGLSWSR